MTRALLIVLALAGVARADDKAAAQRYFTAGAKAYAAQNFAAAIANFEEAYKNLPVPEIAFSAAQAYRKQYRVDDKPEYVKRSVELYRAYLDKVKQGGRVGDAADSLGEMQRELDRLTAAGTKIDTRVVERTRLGVSISTGDGDVSMREVSDASGGAALEGVTATLDGKPLEPFALVDVAEGEHVIAVSAPGFEPVEKRPRAVPGASFLVEATLVPKPARVALGVERGTRVMIDGRPSTSTGTLELVAGKHVITLLRDGREPAAREVVVTRGQVLKLDVPLEKTARRRAVPWVLTGAGALAAGAIATGLGALLADGDASDLAAGFAMGDRPASEAERYAQLVDRRDSLVTATWVLGGAAVVTGAIGLGLYLFDAPSPEGARVITVAPATGGATALIGGRW